MKTKTKKIILDSNILIGILRNDARALALVASIQKSYALPCISIMTHIELAVGAYTEEQKQEAHRLLAHFYCQELTADVARYVPLLLQPFNNDKARKVQLLPDAIIAATAKHLDADICTANVKDFRALSIQDDQIITYQMTKKKKR